MTQLKHITIILDSHNIENTLRYYVQKLGFQVEFRYEQDPDNYAGVFRDNVYLHMQWQAEEEFKANKAGHLRVRINVDNPDELFTEFKSKEAFGNDIQIRNTEWGTREFGFKDLDGNSLFFYADL